MTTKEYNHDYYLKNRERLRKQQKEYFDKNHEQILKQKHENKEQHRKTQRVWRARNREKVRDYELKSARELKMSFVKLLGGKCVGYSCGGIVVTWNNLVIFDFHHIDPKEKDSKVETKTKGFIKKIKEGKIQLLCANCHRLEHYRLRKENSGKSRCA